LQLEVIDMASPTMRRRRLAAELRRLRNDTGLRMDEVCRGLGWPASKLSRIESRQIGINTADLRKLFDVYKVTNEAQRNAMLEMARRSKERGWWQAYGDVIPSEYATMIGLEEEASEIRVYHPELIDGRLQTEEYARAVIRVYRPDDTADEIDRRVEVRMARQVILNRDHPLRLRVVLSEGAVRRVVGGNKVMREQLQRLVAERDRGNVIVQVLPFSAGEHPAMNGPFDLLDFPEIEDLGVVYVENMANALLLEKPEELRLYTEAFDYVSAAALGPRESRDMLISLAAEL
jgi:transcriptional regulator with XRE-family HTH domain